MLCLFVKFLNCRSALSPWGFISVKKHCLKNNLPHSHKHHRVENLITWSETFLHWRLDYGFSQCLTEPDFCPIFVMCSSETEKPSISQKKKWLASPVFMLNKSFLLFKNGIGVNFVMSDNISAIVIHFQH